MKYTKPDWMTGEILEAFDSYLEIRKKKKIVLTARVIKNRIKELTEFRRLELDIVKIIDDASDGNWRKFYLPKGFVMQEEKPVQERPEKKITPEIMRLNAVLRKHNQQSINWHNPQEREDHNRETRRLMKLVADEEKKPVKLGDLL